MNRRWNKKDTYLTTYPITLHDNDNDKRSGSDEIDGLPNANFSPPFTAMTTENLGPFDLCNHKVWERKVQDAIPPTLPFLG